jgi:hypothetical protein
MAIKKGWMPEQNTPTATSVVEYTIADTPSELPVGNAGDLGYSIAGKGLWLSDGAKKKRVSEAHLDVVSKTANYTMTDDDSGVICDATGGSFTVTLPSAASVSSPVVHILKTNLLNTVTVSRAGTDTIEGATTKVLASQFGRITLLTNKSNTWYVLGGIAL